MTPEEQQAQDAAAAEQAKQDADAKARADKDAADAKAKEEGKVGNIFKKGEKKESKVVPEAVFLEQKKALKEAETEIQRLKDAGASRGEIDKSLKDIAEKYDIDPDAISEIASAITKQSEAKVDEKISSRLKPLEQKEQEAEINKLFDEHFSRAMEEMPEYKDVAKKSVIKALSLDPANKDKTFEQILQETYGHVVKSTKKPLEKARSKEGGAAAVEIDFSRAKTDTDYYKEIMADPEKKAAYNKDLAKRIRL